VKSTPVAPLVYEQFVPIDVLREAEGNGQEMVLLEGGTFQAVVFVDRRRHPDWAQAWDAFLPVRRRELETQATVSQMPGGPRPKESTR
jgi:hypothetical protein